MVGRWGDAARYRAADRIGDRATVPDERPQGIEMNWTREYMGVSHRKDVRGGGQITRINRGEFCELYMLNLMSEHPFTPVREFIGTEEECGRKADGWAASLKK